VEKKRTKLGLVVGALFLGFGLISVVTLMTPGSFSDLFLIALDISLGLAVLLKWDSFRIEIKWALSFIAFNIAFRSLTFFLVDDFIYRTMWVKGGDYAPIAHIYYEFMKYYYLIETCPFTTNLHQTENVGGQTVYTISQWAEILRISANFIWVGCIGIFILKISQWIKVAIIKYASEYKAEQELWRKK